MKPLATTARSADLPVTSAWWAGSLGEFVHLSETALVGALASAAGQRGLMVRREQHSAWQASIQVLRDSGAALLNEGIGREWGVILEFEIPRRAIRPDAVVLAGDVIVPIEFKVGATRFDRAARMQVEEYARDLTDFHEASRGYPIVPVLVATEAVGEDLALDAEPILDRAQCTNPDHLAGLLRAIAEGRSRSRVQISLDEWTAARYRPAPGILEAARDVYAGNEVRELSVSYADNLDRTVDAVRSIIARARTQGERWVCFITGVPGSGKTLAGLSAVHEHAPGTGGRALGAYLSGNGPLVEVLRYAIAVDLRRRRGTSARGADHLASTFIQPVHRFVQELANSTQPPPENVIVFDEAQRAWDRARMDQRQGIPASEAGTTLSIMERAPGWAVVVALVGEGQEIHQGEAGIGAWFEALADHTSWHVSAAASGVAGPDAVRRRTEVDDALDLNVSVRSPRAQAIADWAEGVVTGRLDAARQAAELCDGFPMFVTRDLEAMRDYLRDRARLDRRPGLLASSQARRLRPFGIEMDGTFQGGISWARWFVDGGEDIRSSYALEVAASEFKCQGLEIDWAGLCWGSDFTWDPEAGDWRFLKLHGSRLIRDGDEQHARNRYRVLLTRARYGLVVWVPRSRRSVPLVDSRGLDATADALLNAGLQTL